jgi:ABC-type multidrug transport system fused ATPase/permease subunit
LLIAAVTTLSLPTAVRRMIDHGFSAQDAGFINTYFSMLAGIAALLAVASACRYYFVITLGERVVPTSAAMSSTMSRNCPPHSMTPTARAKSCRG